MPMTKSDVVAKVAEVTDLTKDQAHSAVTAMINTIINGVAAGDSVKLNELGTFEKAHVAARKGRNPATGAEIDIAARNRFKFKASSAVTRAINPE